MKKEVFSILFIAVSLLLLAASCKKTAEQVAAPYLKVTPETYDQAALGEGDAFLISIRSNVRWTISAVDSEGNPVDWIHFDVTSGSGDADIFGFILRGDRETKRSCTIIISSEDGKMEKRIEINQGTFTPVILNLQLIDVIKAGYELSPGASENLTDFGVFDAEVVGVPGGNLPDGYAYLTDDGSYFIRVSAPNVSLLKVGDKVKVEMTSGKVIKEASGGYTAVLSEPIAIVSSGAPTVSPVYISSDALTLYENTLVELRNVQAVEESVGKNWDGDVSFVACDEKDASFKIHVEREVSMGSVASGNGIVSGIVVDGKVRPRTVEDIQLANDRLPAWKEPYRIEPIANFLHMGSEANTVCNGTITDKTKFTFTDDPGWSVAGTTIEKVGGTANNMTLFLAVKTPFQSCFNSAQWYLDGSYMLYSIPVNQKIYGDLEFAFSLSCSTANIFVGDWGVFWSKDGTNFKPVDAVYDPDRYTPETAAGNTFSLTKTSFMTNRQVLEISIPESEAVSSGYLYFKMVPPKVTSTSSKGTLRMNCGAVLMSRTTNTPKHGYRNVLAMENFESCSYAHNPVPGFPVYYFTATDGAPAYSNVEGWTITGKSIVVRGCVRLTADSGENYIMSPALSMLKIPSDLTLTFKASPYVDPTGTQLKVHDNNISVDVTGSGTVSEIEWDSPLEGYKWSTGTVKITGASSDTRVRIGNIKGAKTSRAYLDDIIIVKR